MSSCTVFVFSSLMEYLIINIVYLNHNNYAVFGDSANYNGNYYTGYSSNYINAIDYLNHSDSKCECHLSKRRLRKQIKKNLKQKQKSNWLHRWFSSSSSTNSERLNSDKNRDNGKSNSIRERERDSIVFE